MTGRPSDYTPELASLICRRIAEGDNLDRVAQEEGMPSRTAIYDWLKTHAGIADEYARARVMRADSRSDRMDDYGRRMIAGAITPEQARVLIDIEKWQSGKENPKKYGDRTTLANDPDNPVPAPAFSLTVTADIVKDIVKKVRDEF